MWVRKTTDKVSLLTVGNNTYSGDSRISIRFQYPNNWRLKINPVQEQDVGLYMCQVSTHPPIVFATNVTILGKGLCRMLLWFHPLISSQLIILARLLLRLRQRWCDVLVKRICCIGCCEITYNSM